MNLHDYEMACEQNSALIAQTLQTLGILSPNKFLNDFMQTCRFADEHETVFDVLCRSTSFLAEAGEIFYGIEGKKKHYDLFLKHVSSFRIILGSPILTNAGRRTEKSISACSIPPVDLSKMKQEEVCKIVNEYHKRGMGTGFCFDDVKYPAEMVKYLNDAAVKEVQRGDIERSVGNMGVIAIDHPKVLDFIRVKTSHPEIKEWKFNLSVNVNQEFMNAWDEGRVFTLKGGAEINPQDLMTSIAEDAHATGDPGLIFMDRINQLNRLPHIGDYKTVVPCGEVSLFEAEVCQFCYLNLSRFILKEEIDKELLKEAIHAAVILLDNAVESNIRRMPNTQSADIISNVRRIGIGVCGFSEVLQSFGIPYGSQASLKIASNLMSFINFESKAASVELAKERGPFKFFSHPSTRKELFIEPFKAHPTDFVSYDDWAKLECSFQKYGMRNLSTTILPPSGRSALIGGVTPSIEPPFKLIADSLFQKNLKKQCLIHGLSQEIEPLIDHVKLYGSLQGTCLPQAIKAIFQTALEISSKDHLTVTAEFQKFTDEGISKTVNIPNDATVMDIIDTYKLAYELGLKGITIYRDGCRYLQPKMLSSKNTYKVVDPIYGAFSVSPRIFAILNSPFVGRLKKIHQNGINYLIDSRQVTSRYDHSLGALFLTLFLGGNETSQIAALLHDISHTSFSHVIDFVYANQEQNFHDLERFKFLKTPEAREFIKMFSITDDELACEKIPMIKGAGVNVDRLDYCIRDLWVVNKIYHPQYSSILNNLLIDETGAIVCKNLDTARLLLSKFIEVNKEIYLNPKFEGVTLFFSEIIKKLLEHKDLKEEHFFGTDEEVMNKIRESRLNSSLDFFHSNIILKPSLNPFKGIPVHRKLRFIDPVIHGLEGTLTQHCKKSKEVLEEYLKMPRTVYYDLPKL